MRIKATFTFLIAAALLVSGMAIAQDTTDTWRDSVDENDVRYLGTIARVMDDSFELRTLEQGTLTFKIPEPRTDAMTLITTGREVQVWVDGGTVTTIEEYGDPTTRTEFEADTTADVDADADVETDAWNDNVDVDADVDADADMDGDEMSARVSADASVDADADARNEFATGGSVAVRTDDDDVDVDADGYATDDEVETSYDASTSNDDDRWDGETLPQTASALPAALSAGVLLLIAGLAIRRRA